MGLFEQFPYTNFHDLNLDWFLNTFKDLLSEWEEQKREFSSLQDAWNDIREYISTYFDNLDVQEEVNNKIDEMVASGELEQILGGLFSDFESDYNQRLAALSARMDEFASLPDGSTAGDAELLDIRVGANGITYASAGAAVRGQVESIMSALQSIDIDGNKYYPLIPTHRYESQYGYHLLNLTGFNSKIIIDANGGTLYEKVAGVSRYAVAGVPMVLNGAHEFHVDGAEANEPIIYIKDGSFIGGAFLSNRFDNEATTRAVCLTNVYKAMDIECEPQTTFDLFHYAGQSAMTNLNTRGWRYYTLNPGMYCITAVPSASYSIQMTADVVNGLHLMPCVPKLANIGKYYEDIKMFKDAGGGQGVTCTDNYVYQFTGLQNVYKYNFDGDVVETITPASSLGHCNSACWYNDNFYLVDQAVGKVIIADSSCEKIGERSIANIESMTRDSSYFYYLTGILSGNYSSDINLYRCNPDFTGATLIKANVIPDGYVVQGMECCGDALILVCLNASNMGMLRYVNKATGELIKWRWTQETAHELEDVAINKNGEMFISYQTAPPDFGTMLTKCVSEKQINAAAYASSVETGVSIGLYNDPLIITASDDYMVLDGSCYGTFGANIARIPSVFVPHVINYFMYNGYLVSCGSIAQNNDNLPLLNFPNGYGDNKITFDHFIINLKNERWYS